MPRYSDAGGGEEFRQSSMMSPRDTARAYFQSGVQGALLNDGFMAPDSTLKPLELIEYTPYEVPLVSSQVVFNVTNTADMATNPTKYRAYAIDFRDSGLTLAGQIAAGSSFRLPPPLPIKPYSNAAFPSATYSTYNQSNAVTEGAPTILNESRVGNYPYTSYGIGFRIRVNLQFSLPKLWNINILYYLPAGGAIQTFPVVQNNIALYNSVSVGGETIIQSVQADPTLPNTNIDIYWNLYGAMATQPAGFKPVPAGVPTFNAAVLAANPRVVWDCA